MNNLQRKKRAFMSIITRPFGFVRTVSGVPPLSLPYAMEGKADNYVIKGKSVQGKNLVNYPYAIGNSGTTNGIDYTVNADGSIVLNGTATAAIYLSFNIGSSLVKLTPGETYTLSGCPGGGSSSSYFMAIQSNPESGQTVSTTSKGSSFVAQKNSYRIYIFVAANMEVENLTFYPQLEKGSTVTEWQSPVLSPNNPIEIQSVGVKTRNLLDVSKTSASTTIGGITFTNNGDGTITLNGTNTSGAEVVYTYISDYNSIELPGGTYVLSGGDVGGIRLQGKKRGDDAINWVDAGNSVTFTDSDETFRFRLMIRARAGITVDNLIIKPHLQAVSLDRDFLDMSKGTVITGYINGTSFLTASTTKSLYLSCSPMTLYSVSKTASARFAIGFTSEIPSASSIVSGHVSNNAATNITTASAADSKYIVIYLYHSSYDTLTLDEIVNSVRVQEGSTLSEFEPYSKYKLNVVNRGVNLFNVDDFCEVYNSKLTNQAYAANPNDTWLGEKCLSYRLWRPYDDYMWLKGCFKEKTQYTISAEVSFSYSTNTTTAVGIFRVYYTDGTYKDILGNQEKYVDSFNYCIETTSKDKTIDYINMIHYSPNMIPYIKNLQIQEGTTATDYEPYRPPVSTPIYLDEPLRGIGDYKDKIDFESGTVGRKIVAKAFDGSEDWKGYSTFVYLPWNGIKSSTDCLCTHLPNNDVSQSMSTGTVYIRPITDSVRIVMKGGSYTDADEWKSLLSEWNESGNPCILTTQLTTEVVTPITLPDLPLFEGTNILSIEGDIQPDMTVIYKASVKEV
jgi:hypothetical protein